MSARHRSRVCYARARPQPSSSGRMSSSTRSCAAPFDATRPLRLSTSGVLYRSGPPQRSVMRPPASDSTASGAQVSHCFVFGDMCMYRSACRSTSSPTLTPTEWLRTSALTPNARTTASIFGPRCERLSASRMRERLVSSETRRRSGRASPPDAEGRAALDGQAYLHGEVARARDEALRAVNRVYHPHALSPDAALRVHGLLREYAVCGERLA